MAFDLDRFHIWAGFACWLMSSSLCRTIRHRVGLVWCRYKKTLTDVEMDEYRIAAVINNICPKLLSAISVRNHEITAVNARSAGKGSTGESRCHRGGLFPHQALQAAAANFALRDGPRNRGIFGFHALKRQSSGGYSFCHCSRAPGSPNSIHE